MYHIIDMHIYVFTQTQNVNLIIKILRKKNFFLPSLGLELFRHIERDGAGVGGKEGVGRLGTQVSSNAVMARLAPRSHA